MRAEWGESLRREAPAMSRVRDVSPVARHTCRSRNPSFGRHRRTAHELRVTSPFGTPPKEFR
jgi:hypothetical protein